MSEDTLHHDRNSSSFPGNLEEICFSFYNFTRNPLNFLKNKSIDELVFPENYHSNFNVKNLIFNHKKDEEYMENMQEFSKEEPKGNNMININPEDMILENISNNMPVDYSFNNNNLDNNNIQNNNYSNIQNNNLANNNLPMNNIPLSLVLNNTFSINNNNNNFGMTENINYEDFNDMEDLQYMNNNFYNETISTYSDNKMIKRNKNENEDPNCEMLVKSNTVNNLSDRFQVFAIKNQSNIPSSSNKTVLTKEFFSQQVNSLGNIHKCTTVKNAELVELEKKYGISSASLECPNYDSFSEEVLKEEMKKYGMKPGSTKFMVRQLKEIWSFVNMKKLPPNLKTELTKFLSNEISEVASQTSEITGSNISKAKFMGKSSVRQLNDIKKEKVISLIQEDKLMWSKILKFEKIELKEIKEIINKKGIVSENEMLKDFLSELGVIFNQPR